MLIKEAEKGNISGGLNISSNIFAMKDLDIR